MRDVAVIGIGMTEFGELWSDSLRTIWAKAAVAALEDAGIDQVDMVTVGCMSPGLFVGQEHLASLVADELGVAGLAAARVESACASGGVALRTAFLEVASGASDLVLAAGNFFGSNMVNIVLLAGVDLFFHQVPLLRRVAINHSLSSALATILMLVAVISLFADVDLTIGWVGVDSLVIIGLYFAGVWLIQRENSASSPAPPTVQAAHSARGLTSVLIRAV